MVDASTPVPDAARMRYIKLGRQGSWEKECIANGIIRFGFSTADPGVFEMCRDGRWSAFAEYQRGLGRANPTNIRHQAQEFFTDDGSLVWIIFVGDRLYWGRLGASSAERHPDEGGTLRKVAGGWRDTDPNGIPFLKYRLSGKLTTVEMFQGTSCWVTGEAREYAIRRINGQPSAYARITRDSEADLLKSVARLITDLGPRDFETLVDLAFSTSGWRRLGPVGGPEKMRDIALELPLPPRRAFAQVKATATKPILDDYIMRFHAMGDTYDRLFFVHHSGTVATSDPDVTVVGPERLAGMVVSGGLLEWLIDKTY